MGNWRPPFLSNVRDELQQTSFFLYFVHLIQNSTLTVFFLILSPRVWLWGLDREESQNLNARMHFCMRLDVLRPSSSLFLQSFAIVPAGFEIQSFCIFLPVAASVFMLGFLLQFPSTSSETFFIWCIFHPLEFSLCWAVHQNSYF